MVYSCVKGGVSGRTSDRVIEITIFSNDPDISGNVIADDYRTSSAEHWKHVRSEGTQAVFSVPFPLKTSDEQSIEVLAASEFHVLAKRLKEEGADVSIGVPDGAHPGKFVIKGPETELRGRLIGALKQFGDGAVEASPDGLVVDPDVVRPHARKFISVLEGMREAQQGMESRFSGIAGPVTDEPRNDKLVRELTIYDNGPKPSVDNIFEAFETKGYPNGWDKERTDWDYGSSDVGTGGGRFCVRFSVENTPENQAIITALHGREIEHICDRMKEEGVRVRDGRPGSRVGHPERGEEFIVSGAYDRKKGDGDIGAKLQEALARTPDGKEVDPRIVRRRDVSMQSALADPVVGPALRRLGVERTDLIIDQARAREHFPALFEALKEMSSHAYRAEKSEGKRRDRDEGRY